MNKDNQGNGMNTVRPHTEDEIYDLLKQALDAMRLHTAETHPLVETERAMEAVEAKLAQPAQEPIRREQQLFMDEQAFYAAPRLTMRPAELAERLKQGEKWAVAAQPQQEPVAWVGLDLDGMAEAFHRVIEQHHAITNPFHDPVNRHAMIALRELRGLIAYMKRNTSPPVQRQPLTTVEYIQALGPLMEHIECSSGTLHCIVRTIEALHGIKEQP